MTMIITTDSTNPKPTYLQIVECVRRGIATGALKPGDQLPTIREAAISARVNRNTVSRAYLELEHQGLVYSRQGSGCYVSENGPNVAFEERKRFLREKAEELVVEAFHARVPIADVVTMIEEISKDMEQEKNND